jgi:H+/Cl- antiporter ClcA
MVDNGAGGYDIMLARVLMGRETLKIIVSVVGAGVGALCTFVLFEVLLSAVQRHGPGPVPGRVLLFRFQLSAMLATGLFAGLAIVFYARLSRSMADRAKKRESDEPALRKRL